MVKTTIKIKITITITKKSRRAASRHPAQHQLSIQRAYRRPLDPQGHERPDQPRLGVEDGEGDADEQIGVTIVKRALEEPLRQIVQNAGKEGAVIVQNVRDHKKENFGYNAATETMEDLVEAGVIDPAKVTRIALQNAASIAGLMLTTEAMISELPEDDKGGNQGMPGGMGGMGGMGM